MYDMFEHFTKKIQDIGEEKVDREFFQSEEFQTLLFEAFRQLNVTHDREKIEMLGVALANSGAPGFKDDESKELFVRFVRDLTKQHIKMLFELTPTPVSIDSLPVGISEREGRARQLEWDRRPTLSRPRNDDLLALQMLAAYGLVEENLSASIEKPRMGRLFLTIIGSIAELESDLIRERVLAGMRRAKLDGVRIGRAPMNIDRAAIVRDRIGGMTLTAVAKKWSVSRSMVCKLVNRSRAGDEGSMLPPAQVLIAVPYAIEFSGGTLVTNLYVRHLMNSGRTDERDRDDGGTDRIRRA